MVQDLCGNFTDNTNSVAGGSRQIVSYVVELTDSKDRKESVGRSCNTTLVLVESDIPGVGNPFVPEGLEAVVCEVVNDGKPDNSVEEVEKLDDVVAKNSELVASSTRRVVVGKECIYQLVCSNLFEMKGQS